ncbi:hypothetical protein F5J12DRAFT_96046 [Pisolithus orientalis]|uniref:uncharacterized protein n=1 Tax=Pisolithus orientalis TaxID=936130 RepID=UPI002224BCC9|nr:uncharacterized protein F5J12DRAFT_96046 [Pisolithus orientalis]KAI6006507.1 hypothetical protein F5J12DRAFT_96046 [Pisolithus orientalis]
MSSSPYGFLYNPSLPSEETIVAHCLNLGFVCGTTIVDPSTTSVIAWIKYGRDVTVAEARTQDWTAKALRDTGASDIRAPRVFHAFTADYHGWPVGYIAMEYIEGTDCGSKDVELVAKAVQALIGLQAPPTATLGHIGGGTRSIVHSFFPEWLPNANYRSDQDFYAHIRNIFKMLPIDFHGDISSHDRFLCPSDFNSGNFRKRTMEDGRLVVAVLDFGATCFMPLPFIEVALKKPWDRFSQLVVRKIIYPHPWSDDARFLLCASGLLVQYGFKPVALPSGVSPR